MSVLPEAAKRSIKRVLVDFDLSMIVSVPTSRRPIERGSMLYFFKRFETTVRARELMSSLSNSVRYPHPVTKEDGILLVICESHVFLSKTESVFA